MYARDKVKEFWKSWQISLCWLRIYEAECMGNLVKIDLFVSLNLIFRGAINIIKIYTSNFWWEVWMFGGSKVCDMKRQYDHQHSMSLKWLWRPRLELHFWIERKHVYLNPKVKGHYEALWRHGRTSWRHMTSLEDVMTSYDVKLHTSAFWWPLPFIT